MKFLDSTGLSTLWTKIKEGFLSLSGGTVTGDVEIIGSTTLSGTKNYLGISKYDTIYRVSEFEDGDLRLRHVTDSNGSYTELLLNSSDGTIKRTDGSATEVFATNGTFIDTSLFAKASDITDFVTVDQLDEDYLVDYLPLAGGTMTGLLATKDSNISVSKSSSSDTTLTNYALISGTGITLFSTKISGGLGTDTQGTKITMSSTTSEYIYTQNILQGLPSGLANYSLVIGQSGTNFTVDIKSHTTAPSITVSGEVEAANVEITSLTSDQLSAIASSIFEFNLGSYHSAKLIGWDSDNKVATITFNILCDNPVTVLSVSETLTSSMVGVIIPRNTAPYIGAITLAVPLNDSYTFDGNYGYTIDSL